MRSAKSCAARALIAYPDSCNLDARSRARAAATSSRGPAGERALVLIHALAITAARSAPAPLSQPMVSTPISASTRNIVHPRRFIRRSVREKSQAAASPSHRAGRPRCNARPDATGPGSPSTRANSAIVAEATPRTGSSLQIPVIRGLQAADDSTGSACHPHSSDDTPVSLQHSLDLLTRHIAGSHDRAGSLAFAVTIPEGEEIRAG